MGEEQEPQTKRNSFVSSRSRYSPHRPRTSHLVKTRFNLYRTVSQYRRSFGANRSCEDFEDDLISQTRIPKRKQSQGAMAKMESSMRDKE
jgi:hypothetical protein